MNKKPTVIAEIGCNHMGSMDMAFEMIKTASVFCKVDVVKFQKRTPKELLSENEYNSPHPNPNNSFGNTYGEHREFLEFNLEQHKQLKKYCENESLIYSSSVWDIRAAEEIVSINPSLIKVPSAANLDFDLLNYLIKDYGGEIHLSLGMTTRSEEDSIVDLFTKNNRAKDLTLYACTSGYPVPFEDICLLEIKRLKDKYGEIIKEIGFSGHHLGIAVDVAALALGATTFERHFTLDRTLKGTDHAASLEPEGMRKLARDLRNVTKALTFKNIEILEIENAQREKLKRKTKE